MHKPNREMVTVVIKLINMIKQQIQRIEVVLWMEVEVL